MRDFWRDLRFGARMLARSRGFTLAAVLLLALGVGGNAAIFSVLRALLLRPLPYRDPDRLVMLWEKNPKLDELIANRVQARLSVVLEWRRERRLFEDAAAFQESNFNLTGQARPERLAGAMATPNFFETLGVAPLAGHTFSAAGPEDSAVLSYSLFERRFGADPRVVGRRVRLNGTAYTVIGVLPRSFHLPAMWEGLEQKKPEVWVPLRFEPAEDNRSYVFARLRPGVTVEQARAGLEVVSRRMRERDPVRNADWSASVFPLREEDTGPAQRRTMQVFQAAVGFVLLIACANLAHLLLARMAGREREFAVRTALGAGRARLVRQLLAESLLLGAAGAAAGVLLAQWSLAAIAALAPGELGRLGDAEIDGPVVLFALALAALSSLLAGLVPALYAARRYPGESLRRGGRALTAGTGRLRLLGVYEVALATLLLVGAGLATRSLTSLLAVDPGFDPRHVLSARLTLPQNRYRTDEQVSAFSAQLLERAARLPGVRAAALASGLPMQHIAVRPVKLDGGGEVSTDYRAVSEDYFTVMGMRLLRGRAFTLDEARNQAPVAVVNESLARRLWPGRDPVGMTAHVASLRFTVVGLAADTRQLMLSAPPRTEIFYPTRALNEMSLVLRTEGPPALLSRPLTELVLRIDPEQPLDSVSGMAGVVRDSAAREGFLMTLLNIFAGVALVMAVTGLYALLASSVNRRTREIGIRMALGARARDVVRMVMREGLTMVTVGLAAGLAGALAMVRMMAGLLFGIAPFDAVAFTAAPVLLAAAAAAAVWLPARRASRLDPVRALRHE